MIRCKLIESENTKNSAGFDQSYMNLAGYPITTNLHEPPNADGPSTLKDLKSNSSSSSTPNTNRFVNSKIGRKICAVGVIYN